MSSASAATSISQSAASRFWNGPTGPKTIWFWCPIVKWGIVGAGLKDINRPAEKLSLSQSMTLATTGLIWARYSTVIVPVNYNLMSVNLFVGATGIYQLLRIWQYEMDQKKLKQPVAGMAAMA
ncbi:mitochondrial pyruvate carrier [Chytriomyces cf. hyalinus JEL632]|nr:mitochondrial pyruvate carrier [Chytriomyces cf. hyalinus JEL632]